MLSTALIVPIALVVLLLALLSPVYGLLFADLATALLPGEWDVAAIRFGPSDFVTAALVVAIAVRLKNRGGLPRRTMMLWSLLVLIMAVSYLSAPAHSRYFQGPIEIVYQLLRYVLKPLLYLPIVVLLFRDQKRLDRLVFAFLVVSTVAAFMICVDGYTGQSARGPFQGKNLAGGAMVLPLLFALYRLVRARSLSSTLFFGACLLLIARAALFVGSRGAFASLLFALALLAVPLLRAQGHRYRVLRLVPLALVVVLLVLLAKPDLFQRESMQAVLSVGEGLEEKNMQWRMNERWPHFWALALEHPWLGMGTHVDESLGTQANTPHSGYLAGAVEFGFPASLLLFGLGLGAVLRCWRLARQLPDESLRLLATFIGAALASIFVHLIVEATIFQSDFMMNVYLMLVGMSLALANLSEPLARSQPARRSRRPRRRVLSLAREPTGYDVPHAVSDRS